MGFTFRAYGHPAVLSTHQSTIEITKDSQLSTRGDCIVAVNSSKAAQDLPDGLKKNLARACKARVVIGVGLFRFVIEGEGDPRLSFSHPTELVVRKSGFISDRTLMIHADKAAGDLPREMVRLLQDPKSQVTIEISTIKKASP